MMHPGQAIDFALDIRNKKLHYDRCDRARLKLKVAASALHSHLLALLCSSDVVVERDVR
jgi:hypothetical protein